MYPNQTVESIKCLSLSTDYQVSKQLSLHVDCCVRFCVLSDISHSVFNPGLSLWHRQIENHICIYVCEDEIVACINLCLLSVIMHSVQFLITWSHDIFA